jgi:MoaA/NifB/PqqE/SkfB family radical SAM enzyme
MKKNNHHSRFLTGPQKCLIYGIIAVHVTLHYALETFSGRIRWHQYPAVLRRAGLFLLALRHHKVVRHERKYKLHLYVPAYPTRAFFHTLEKFFKPDPGPATVVLSMTRACTYHCPHCYQRRDLGTDLPMETLTAAAQAMQQVGVSMFDIEGGEPLLQMDRLIELMSSLDERAEIWVNTTGAELSEDKIRRMIEAKLFGVMISLHSPDAKAHDDFTGVEGSFDVACRALRRFAEQGVVTAINCCSTSTAVLNGDIEKLIALARELECSFVQLIHPKPSGAWLGREQNPDMAPEVINSLCVMHRRYNSGKQWRSYPSISSQVFEESPQLFGCTAGGVDRFYLGADGEVQPCEFLNVSFGNVCHEPFDVIFRRMRRFFPTPCNDWLCCTLAESISQILVDDKLERTPIPWEITQKHIADWPRGPQTSLYQNLGIYRKK